MNTYIDGNAGILVIDLVDDNGNSLSATSVEYSIADGKGVQKLARQSLSGFVTGDSVATINLSTAVNTMAPIGNLDDEDVLLTIREPRVVTLYLTTDDGNKVQTEIYVVERANLLVEGVNSYVSYSEAVVGAMSFVGLDNWSNATKNERITALLLAARKIKEIALEFDEGDMKRVSYKLNRVFALKDIGQSDYLGMDAKFKEDVGLAQILEANALLEKDEMHDLIDNGVTAKKIGETYITFRQTKQIRESLCKEAMKFLRPYMKTSAMIGRA